MNDLELLGRTLSSLPLTDPHSMPRALAAIATKLLTRGNGSRDEVVADWARRQGDETLQGRGYHQLVAHGLKNQRLSRPALVDAVRRGQEMDERMARVAQETSVD